jgi:hypothetical protein
MFRKFALPLFAAAIITAAMAPAAHAQVIQCGMGGTMPMQQCTTYCLNVLGQRPACTGWNWGGICTAATCGPPLRKFKKSRNTH